MESRIIELEIKLSLAEDLLEELNRTVFRQQEQIDSLQRQLLQLSRQVRDNMPAGPGDPRQEIPPHY